MTGNYRCVLRYFPSNLANDANDSLNIFGFLSHPDLSATDGTSGNYGSALAPLAPLTANAPSQASTTKSLS